MQPACMHASVVWILHYRTVSYLKETDKKNYVYDEADELLRKLFPKSKSLLNGNEIQRMRVGSDCYVQRG